MKKGYGITETQLQPLYPNDYDCPPLTSLYASWIDVDGSRRDEIHSGVDGGRLGDWILAPAPGIVRAAWEANWQWGPEGALLLRHTRADVNLSSGPAFYYSVFDHLDYDEIKKFKPGQIIKRGQRLARVSRPGGKKKYLPEVHWEVWEVGVDDLVWSTNQYNAPVWRNPTAKLIDPLYMLGLHSPPADDRTVAIKPFKRQNVGAAHRGFTYIFECKQKAGRKKR